jgi:hypothetical protein
LIGSSVADASGWLHAKTVNTVNSANTAKTVNTAETNSTAKIINTVETTNTVKAAHTVNTAKTADPTDSTRLVILEKLSSSTTWIRRENWFSSMDNTRWDFESLTNTISYHRQPSRKPSQNGPSLVILCTWMSANRKHIAKYTQQYRQQYPAAEVLVVESGVADMVYRSKQSQQHRLRPASDILVSHLSSTAHQRGAVLHMFSNGGAQCAVQLAAMLPPDTRRHAFSSIILDSCPGTATYWRTVHAMSLSMPRSSVAKVLGPPILHLVLCVIFLALFATGAEDVITRIRKQLNDEDLFGHDIPRLYLYSKADQLVPWQDVKSHADDARRKGYVKTSELMFEASAHCAHAMSHKDQYREAIGALLETRDSSSVDRSV